MRTIDDRIVETDENQDRRDTYRMPKQDSQREAKLKIGKKLIQVELLDESAGGFLVSGVRIPSTKPSDTVELFSSHGAHFLRVAWRRNVDGRTRLGLQRICHLPSSDQEESPWLIWFVAAMVVGIGFGFVVAANKNPNVFHRMLYGQQVVSTVEAMSTQ